MIPRIPTLGTRQHPRQRPEYRRDSTDPYTRATPTDVTHLRPNPRYVLVSFFLLRSRLPRIEQTSHAPYAIMGNIRPSLTAPLRFLVVGALFSLSPSPALPSIPKNKKKRKRKIQKKNEKIINKVIYKKEIRKTFVKKPPLRSTNIFPLN
jgi:hypothetical protein